MLVSIALIATGINFNPIPRIPFIYYLTIYVGLQWVVLKVFEHIFCPTLGQIGSWGCLRSPLKLNQNQFSAVDLKWFNLWKLGLQTNQNFVIMLDLRSSSFWTAMLKSVLKICLTTSWMGGWLRQTQKTWSRNIWMVPSASWRSQEVHCCNVFSSISSLCWLVCIGNNLRHVSKQIVPE